MKLRFASLTGALLAGTSGCLGTMDPQLQTLTSGSIGCPPAEIEISNIDGAGAFGGPTSWQSACRGRTFQCSVVGSQIACTPMLVAQAPSGPAAAPVAAPIDAGATALAPVPVADPAIACPEAAEYDRKAAAATSPAREQFAKIAAHKHKDCDARPQKAE